MGIHISESLLRVCEPIKVEIKLSKFTPRQISGIVNMIERRRVRGSGVTSKIARSFLEEHNIGFFLASQDAWRNITEYDWDSGLAEQLDMALLLSHLDEEVAKHEANKSNWSRTLKEGVEEAMTNRPNQFHLPWCHDNARKFFHSKVQLPKLDACKEITTRLRDGSITSVTFNIHK